MWSIERFCFALALGIVLLAFPAWAQPSDAPRATADLRTAEEYFERGLRAAARQDYEAARRAFEKAYALSRDDEALRNLAVAELRSGRALEGARHLTQYLDRHRVSAEEADVFRKQLEAAEQELGRVAVNTDVDGATVFVDGVEIGDSPLRSAYHVAPGEHRVRAEKDGYAAAEARATVRAGELLELSLALQPDAESAAPASLAPSRLAPPDEPRKDSPFIDKTVVVVGLGVLTLGAGVLWYGFHAAGASAEDEARALRAEVVADSGSLACTGASAGSPACRELGDKVDAANRAYTLSNVAQVGTFVLALGTAAAFVFWPNGNGEAPHVAATPWLSPDGAGLGARGSF